MKTEPAILPTLLEDRGSLVTDEVVFAQADGEGRSVQVRVPLALGLLYAANALRAGESFTLDYPGETAGHLARHDGERLALDKEVAETFEGMVAFLDRYAEALAEQLSAAGASAADSPLDAAAEPENLSPSAA